MKALLLQVLIELAKRFITADNIKKVSKELTDELLEFVENKLEADKDPNELELLLIQVIKEIRG